MAKYEDSYFETQSERQSIATSARAERSMNGLRKDSIPTKKQYDAMCGEVVTYNYGKPMKWAEYKTWDAVHRREYIETLIRNYDASMFMLAEMFGVSKVTVQRELSTFLKIKTNCKPGKNPDREEKWKAFLSNAENDVKEEPITLDEVQQETKTAETADEVNTPEKTSVIFNLGEVSADGVVSEIFPALVQFLSGKIPDKAKITMSWELV